MVSDGSLNLNMQNKRQVVTLMSIKDNTTPCLCLARTSLHSSSDKDAFITSLFARYASAEQPILTVVHPSNMDPDMAPIMFRVNRKGTI